MPDTPAPVASDLIAPAGNTFPVTDRQTREQAFQVMAKLRSDSEFRNKYLAGDKAVQAEVRAAHETTLTSTALKIHGKDAPEDRASMIGSLQNFADVPEAVQKQLYEGQAVSAEEQKFAQQTKSRLMQDKDWVRKYLDGGRAERQQMVLLNTILTSPTSPTKK
jgi:hypothetical protein